LAEVQNALGGIRSGVRGQSVRSMVGAVWMLLNSAVSSVNIVARNVSIAGPAGTQLSEHGEPGVEQGAGIARATGTDGSWKLLDIAPEKEARENTTAKSSVSLTIEIVFILFSERAFCSLPLKDYPLSEFIVNPKQDPDICRIP